MRKMCEKLPQGMARLFWDCDFSSLSWEEHRDFIISRVLSHGKWDDIRWLMDRVGLDSLREWFLSNEGRGLSRRQLYFWALLLDVPGEVVEGWMGTRERTWEERVAR